MDGQPIAMYWLDGRHCTLDYLWSFSFIQVVSITPAPVIPPTTTTPPQQKTWLQQASEEELPHLSSNHTGVPNYLHIHSKYCILY